MYFEISFHGHKNIRSLHPKTIEITTDSDLTIDGDCIIGVRASSGCRDIPNEMKMLLQNRQSEIICTILVGNLSFKVTGKGSENLSLTHPHDIVIRKSSFVCPRTLAINCDAASDFIPPQMIKVLQNPETIGIFRIEVK